MTGLTDRVSFFTPPPLRFLPFSASLLSQDPGKALTLFQFAAYSLLLLLLLSPQSSQLWFDLLSSRWFLCMRFANRCDLFLLPVFMFKSEQYILLAT